MEKYEINKFITEYETKLNDLKVALNVEGKTPRLAELEKETVKDDFWLDQDRAQGIISEVNQLKDSVKEELSKVAGLTKEEAKKSLIDACEEEAKLEAAKTVREIEQEAKDNASAIVQEALINVLGISPITRCIP